MSEESYLYHLTEHTCDDNIAVGSFVLGFDIEPAVQLIAGHLGVDRSAIGYTRDTDWPVPMSDRYHIAVAGRGDFSIIRQYLEVGKFFTL